MKKIIKMDVINILISGKFVGRMPAFDESLNDEEHLMAIAIDKRCLTATPLDMGKTGNMEKYKESLAMDEWSTILLFVISMNREDTIKVGLTVPLPKWLQK